MKTLNINNFEEKIIYEKLENNMEVYLVPTKKKENYYCSFTTRYGGENLKFKVDNKVCKTPSGIAHFLEHKLFEHQPNPFEFYGKSGTDVNASTTSDYTSFYFLGNNCFLDNLEYLVKWIPNLSITEEQVTKEKGIILEEASMYKDNPDRILYQKSLSNVFINDDVRKKVIGTDSDIKKITKEELELCYTSFYRPDNMFLIAVGGFNAKEALDIIKKNLKSFKNPSNKVEKIVAKEKDEVYKTFEKIKMDIETPKVALNYKINKNKFKKLKLDKYFLDYYLNMIIALGFGSTSDFREYLLNNSLFTSSSYQLMDTNTHYVISFYATTNKPKELIEKTRNYFKNIELNKENFERLKKIWIASEVRMIDSIHGTANNIMYDVLDYGEYKNNKINDIRSLSYDTLNKVKECLDLNNEAVIVINK